MCGWLSPFGEFVFFTCACLGALILLIWALLLVWSAGVAAADHHRRARNVNRGLGR